MIPELTDIGAERKVLPLGRYSCTLDEVRERCVPEGDENRTAIWDGFLKTVDFVKATVGSLAEVWIGGSFITDEEHPHDIDAVFFFKEERLAVVSQPGIFVLNVLAGCLGRGKRLNEYVDGYLVVVQPTENIKTNISKGGFPLAGIGISFGRRRDLVMMMCDGFILRLDIWR